MKRRILLVDDDLAILLTLKAVLELHGFEVETANSSAEATARLESGIYHMVISDLNMETREAGLEVIRTAHRQHYDPATALFTAYPPADEPWNAERWNNSQALEKNADENLQNGEARAAAKPDSLLIKPLGTADLLRQVEALLVAQADKQQRNAVSQAHQSARRAG